MDDVFDAFPEFDTPYTFLLTQSGGVMGDVTTSYSAIGVFKHRDGRSVASNQETRESDATLHIRPTESFIALCSGNLVGQGIIKDGAKYNIIGQTIGMDFSHYRVTLARRA